MRVPIHPLTSIHSNTYLKLEMRWEQDKAPVLGEIRKSGWMLACVDGWMDGWMERAPKDQLPAKKPEPSRLRTHCTGTTWDPKSKALPQVLGSNQLLAMGQRGIKPKGPLPSGDKESLIQPEDQKGSSSYLQQSANLSVQRNRHKQATLEVNVWPGSASLTSSRPLEG